MHSHDAKEQEGGAQGNCQWNQMVFSEHWQKGSQREESEVYPQPRAFSVVAKTITSTHGIQ